MQKAAEEAQKSAETAGTDEKKGGEEPPVRDAEEAK